MFSIYGSKRDTVEVFYIVAREILQKFSTVYCSKRDTVEVFYIVAREIL